MKPQLIFSFLFTAALQAVHAEGTISDECGDLGVFKVNLDTLPAGVDPTQLRRCANHPLAKDVRVKEARTNEFEIDKRACWSGNPSGCKEGRCWRSCGTGGSWCWSSKNDGYGDWITCGSDGDCNTGMSCGKGECPSCGCSC